MADEKKPAKKPKMFKCEVLRGIGIDADEATLKEAELRCKRRNIPFIKEGLTSMVYPNKPTSKDNGKTIIEPEPVFVDLPREVARKLQKVGAVRVDI